MRALLAIGGFASAVGLGLLVAGVRQQVAVADCGRRCGEAQSWPVTLGILLLVGGGFLLLWAVAAGAASRALYPVPQELQERARLRRVGHRGRGRVLRAQDSGISATGEAVMEMDLEVRLPGQGPYRVRHRAPVSAWWMWRLRIGRPLRVYVDPENPEHLVISWSL